jgi:hypothetical protein
MELPEVFLPAGEAPPVAASAASQSDLDKAEAAAADEVDKEVDPQQVLIQRLIDEASVDGSQAIQIASLLELSGGADNLGDDGIVRVLGTKAKLAGVKRVLKG